MYQMLAGTTSPTLDVSDAGRYHESTLDVIRRWQVPRVYILLGKPKYDVNSMPRLNLHNVYATYYVT